MTRIQFPERFELNQHHLIFKSRQKIKWNETCLYHRQSLNLSRNEKKLIKVEEIFQVCRIFYICTNRLFTESIGPEILKRHRMCVNGTHTTTSKDFRFMCFSTLYKYIRVLYIILYKIV